MQNIKILHRTKKMVTVHNFKVPCHHWQEHLGPKLKRSWVYETRRISGQQPLTLPRLLVIFITHPSLIILVASWAVFRESSKPRKGEPKQNQSLVFLGLGLGFFFGEIQDILHTRMFSSLKLYSQILQRSVKALWFLVVKHLKQTRIIHSSNTF